MRNFCSATMLCYVHAFRTQTSVPKLKPSKRSWEVPKTQQCALKRAHCVLPWPFHGSWQKGLVALLDVQTP